MLLRSSDAPPLYFRHYADAAMLMPPILIRYLRHALLRRLCRHCAIAIIAMLSARRPCHVMRHYVASARRCAMLLPP